MAYNFDELNTVNIWNINDKVREDNAAVMYVREGARPLRPYCTYFGSESSRRVPSLYRFSAE